MVSFKYYPHGKRKAFTMSFDDGKIHDLRLIDIFNKYGIKGTFHINSSKIGLEGYISESDLKEKFILHEVACHTVNHPFLEKCPKAVVVSEVLEDKRALERIVGYPVRGMSYPMGTYNEEIMNTISTLGIDYSRTVDDTTINFSLPENFLKWQPTCHHYNGAMNKLADFKNNYPWRSMELLYIWGHSYEFDNDNSWDSIEDLCKAAANDDNVWYATNIEIFDYISALRSLKMTADSDCIYNPSCIPVWVDVDGSAILVDAGETKRF